MTKAIFSVDAAPPVLTRSSTSENQRQLARFLVIGFASVAVDFGSYLLLDWLGLPSPAAKGTSYFVGTLAGFVGNKFWTFRSSRRGVLEPLNYMVLYTVTLLVNVGVHTATLRITGPSGAAIAYLAATGVTTVLNFVGMKWFAFRVGVQQRQANETGERAHRPAARRSRTSVS